MFTLHNSNKTEVLLTDLLSVIKNTPLSSPFEKEVFLIQHAGMERWLSQQLASHFKVWGNYQFLIPGRFFNTVAQKIHSRLNDAVFDNDVMVWRIESLLRDEFNDNEYATLKHYLVGDNAALKRYQLARKLAHIFDQYQMLRPDLLAAWQQNQLVYDNEPERWQKMLWHRISSQLGDKNKAMLWQETIARLTNTTPGTFTQYLPERIFIFGINRLPPLMLDFLQALARHCQLHFFLLNALPLANAQSQNSLKTPHPLLLTLGQQGTEFQNMLLERGLFAGALEAITVTKNPKTILEHLQNAISNNPHSVQPLPKDDSISIHACHSRMREVEVLRDQLLNALEHDTTLELRDIVVMSPDIRHYTPFISAVFSDIQHTIADRTALVTNHTLNAFIDFLQISQGRFGWKNVLDLLERPIIYPGFNLSDNDLDLIKHWLQDTCVRWAKSAEHKQDLGLFASAENTWQATLDRLLMGYALGDDSNFVDDVLPYKDIEGSSAQALGGLHDFLQLLCDASTQLKQPVTLTEWSSVLYNYADQLLMAADATERQQLNEFLLELSGTLGNVHPENVDLQVIVAWLQDQADLPAQGDTSSGFLRGQLTFCGLQPMRAIPFKVIALLGMNEGDFPRIDPKPTFDLLTQASRPGDGSRRDDDRTQFLEILLSTRQQLIITYVGQSIKHNNRITPSIVVSELLDALHGISELTIYHPLHAFSPRYFKSGRDLFSFSQTDCDTAKALAQPNEESNVWWHGALAIPEDNVFALADVFRFFQHPQRYFMTRQLDVRFNGIESEADEREAFALDKLEVYAALNQGIKDRLKGASTSVKKRQAQGRWLSGVMGELEAENQKTIVDNFVARINALQLGEKVEDVSVDMVIDKYRLVGTLSQCYENGSLFYRYAPLKGKDFACAIVHHLIVNRVHPQATYLLSPDETIVLLPEHCTDDYLPILIDIYHQGQQRPDAFFVEAMLAYVQQACKSKANDDAQAFEKAKAHLAKTINQPYELEIKRLFGSATNLEFILGDTFEQQCQAVFLPLWRITH